MTFVIAVCGKGGAGKTTTSSIMIEQLCKKYSTLAMDADPNSNLAEALGVEAGTSVAQIINGLREKEGKGGESKPDWAELEVNRAVREADGYDILSMGLPEGEGCYCYPNNILKHILSKLRESYQLVLIDCEAGMEHISRTTVSGADVMFIVTDTSIRGARTACRIQRLATELKACRGQYRLLINRTRDNVPPSDVTSTVEGCGFSSIDTLPEEPALREADERGEPIAKVTRKGSPFYDRLEDILKSHGLI